MERLTTKNEQFNDYSVVENLRQLDVREYITLVNNKLGKLEDLEEQIGCPLEVFVKAMQNGIYRKGLFDDDLYRFGRVYIEDGYFCDFAWQGEVPIKDYKKTWWLKEDRSE